VWILVITKRRNAFLFLPSFGLKMLLFRYAVVFKKGEGLSNDKSRDWIGEMMIVYGGFRAVLVVCLWFENFE
jgi:hypothetical protein